MKLDLSEQERMDLMTLAEGTQDGMLMEIAKSGRAEAVYRRRRRALVTK